MSKVFSLCITVAQVDQFDPTAHIAVCATLDDDTRRETIAVSLPAAEDVTDPRDWLRQTLASVVESL